MVAEVCEGVLKLRCLMRSSTVFTVGGIRCPIPTTFTIRSKHVVSGGFYSRGMSMSSFGVSGHPVVAALGVVGEALDKAAAADVWSGNPLKP